MAYEGLHTARNCREGNVYLIRANEKDPRFDGALVVVTEVKSWGIQGAIWAPNGAQIFVRKQWYELEYVGKLPT
jgi:hypothetical protein